MLWVASCFGVAFGLMNSLYTLRVHRFAAAIDMIAAGTSAPIAMAANATPANQGENWSANSCRHRLLRVLDRDPGGDRRESEQREQAEQEGVRRQQRSVAPDHRAVLRTRSTPVSECGYMNSASAEPSASEA